VREINVNEIRKKIAGLSVQANTVLRDDIEKALQKAVSKEKNSRAKGILKILLENAEIARREKIAICQDTGIVLVDMEIGQDINLKGGDLKKAVDAGIKEGYSRGYFRKSVILDPILRNKGSDYIPSIIYTDIVKGNKIRLAISPKGFGSENKSRLKMFNPTDDKEKIIKFILDTVRNAGADACPPFILGIGIGGSFEKAALLAKKALLKPIDKRNSKPHLRRLEDEILEKVNKLNIGPMGLGGSTTCLGVNILDAPTHIAGLPVAVNVGCHATRSATAII